MMKQILDPFEINQFRKDLPIYRAVAGWTSEYMADLLGISRSTLSKIENADFGITVIQYYGILKLLEYECEANGYLAYVIDLLVDDYMTHSEAEKHDFRNGIIKVLNGYKRKLGVKDLQEKAISFISDFINKHRRKVNYDQKYRIL